MIGTAIGAGLQAAGAIYGSIKQSKMGKKLQAELDRRRQENQNWFDRRYNEDATQRADTQALLTRMSEQFRNRTQAAQGTAAVMGASGETVAAQKEAANRATADTVASINAQNEARKDRIESQYMARKEAIDDAQRNADISKMQQTAAATQALADVGTGIAEAFIPKKKQDSDN